MYGKLREYMLIVVKIGNFSNIVLLKELMLICFFILIKYNEFVF